jgi:hypothetical protein
LLLLQLPPGVRSFKLVVAPVHTLRVPVIPDGNGFMVTDALAAQPVPSVYTIVVVPAPTPVTIPEEVPTVAVPGRLLVQVPPVVASLRIVVVPGHALSVPVIAAGNGLMMIVSVPVIVLVQPVTVLVATTL